MGGIDMIDQQMSPSNSVSASRFPSSRATRWMGIAAVTLGLPFTAQAQSASQGTAASAAQQPGVGDIIVTASKRPELLSKTPVAVTVINTAALDQRGVTRIENLTTSIPNTQLFYVATGGVQLGIRGISTNQNNELGNPSVAFHIDGVYEPRPENLTGILYDVDRIEVLRGPQGTLYGRNATVGSINVVTAAPKGKLEAFGDVSYGNYNDVLIRGVVNIPVTDTFAVRASAVYHRNDGYQRETSVGNYFKADEVGNRVTALWRPSQSFSWQIEGDYDHNQGTPPLAELSILPAGTSRFHQNVDTPGYIDTQSYGVRSRMEYKFTPDLSLAYIAGYGKLKGRTQYDMDGTTSQDHINRYIRNQDHWSHELNLNYDTKRLKVLLGAFYFQERPRTVLNQDNGVFDYSGIYPDLTLKNRSYAFFGQATYSITEAIRLTGGVRYSHDQAMTDGRINYFCPYGTAPSFTMASPSAACSPFGVIGPQDARWSKVTWKAGIDADLSSGTLAYATVSTGYKAGVLGNNGLIPDADPETSTNYEIGLKTHLLNNKLLLSLSAFWMDYKDLQISTLFAPRGTNGTVVEGINNVGKARSRGVEAEFAWSPTRDDQFSGFASFIDARYLRYPDANNYQLDPDNGVLSDNSGNRLVLSPKWSGRFSYSHTFHIGDATLVPSASIYYQSMMYLTPFNLSVDRQKGYTKSDITLTYNFAGEHLSIEGFVHNLEDRKVATMQFNYELPVLRYYSDPRTYGVRIGFKY
jgi:iron complex outermembrane receptor protein